MIAESLISTNILPLQTSDLGSTALEMMGEFYVRHLPIVNNQQLLGLISEDDVLNFDINEAIGSYSLSLIRPYAQKTDHIYELMRLMAQLKLTVIPIVDHDQNYVGVVTLEDLLHFFAHTASFTEPGSILILEVARRDYSLSEIARIVESEQASILNVFLTTDPNSTRIRVTLKINHQQIAGIVATFERFEYDVNASFSESDYMDSLKERYDSLMSYLNV
ncbi:MAG: CBS domain-containing protein [Saprospiraceae bacterium]|nr:CBS domain-containing protein [Saprospiraceae bacterium]